MFAEIVFFQPFKITFTYKIPGDLEESIAIGKRVIAPFGTKTYSGYCISISETSTYAPEKIKDIFDVIDPEPILTPNDILLYKWMADYYFSPLGEVLKLTIPHGSETQSKRRIAADTAYCKQLFASLPVKATLKRSIVEILINKNTVTLAALQKEVKRKNIYFVIRALQAEGALSIIDDELKPRIKEKQERFVQLSVANESALAMLPELEKRSKQQVLLLLKLIEAEGAALPLAALAKETDAPLSSFDSLAKKGVLKIFYRAVDRQRKETFQNDLAEYTLTEQQQSVYAEVAESITDGTFKPFLLHGVTGSGKTLVYLELTKKVLDTGKSVLLLVPEISLTPQITSRFYHRFQDEVIVLHSKISDGERFDAWMKAIRGRARVVIGARSALFAPLRDIGLIIIDEEHDGSYKQNDTVPRYHARDCAVYKAMLASCPILLGSATPSLETMHNAESGKYRLLSLPERVDDAKLPEITLINVVQEKRRNRMLTLFSQTMIEKIRDRLQKKEGIIVLQNRRGFSTTVYCFDCGEIEMCENCSVSLVHHIDANYISCHYCGFKKPVPSQCTKCGSFSIKYFGTGTERVEDELAYYFPDAVTKRIDSDSLTKIGSFGKVLSEFRDGDIDILVGTQIVAKGLDFARVTLVCVISAETNLWIPDFRADERTFQLLTQVSGRAGRSSAAGEVLIQTQDDSNRVLQKVIKADYTGFYKSELFLRERHKYPPFMRLCLIEMKDTNEDKVKFAIADFHSSLSAYKNFIIISPPTSAVIAKINNVYRYQILVKGEKERDRNGEKMRTILNDCIAYFTKNSKYKDVQLILDMDPQVVL